MKTISADEMKKLEEHASQLGIPKLILMELAGMKVANSAVHEVKHIRSAVIVCGNGGNGGDGFVAARYLHNAGINTDVFLTHPESEIKSPDARSNLNILKNLGIVHTEITSDGSMNKLKDSLMGADIVIDAIFGIGFSGDVKGTSMKAVKMINETKLEIKDRKHYIVLSIDVPSGSNASTGEVPSVCVEADLTITFEYPKSGLFKHPASKYAGKIITVGIGIPKPNPIEGQMRTLVAPHNEQDEAIEGFRITDSKFVARVVPKRRIDFNKGDCGKVLVIAGSSGMMGAAVLTSNSALRCGSGLVTLCVPDNIKDFINTMSLETIVAGMSRIRELLKECDVIALGPGLSKGRNIERLVKDIISSNDITIPLVIDADGLNAIKDPAILKNSKKEIVITPHPGEFSRLLKIPVDEIQRNRTGYASKFAVEQGITVVLKGAYTVIAGKDKQTYINPVGNPGMASAGIGDVLTGIIASFIGQGVAPFNAAVASAYVHGMAGNLASSIKGEHGIIASDIIDSIPFTIGSIL